MMSPRAFLVLSLGLSTLLHGPLLPAAPTTTAADLLQQAAVVWHMNSSDSTPAGAVTLQPQGDVTAGTALSEQDAAASRARGGDGIASRFGGGHLSGSPSALSQLPLKGDALTLLLRLRVPDTRLPNGEFLARHGGHDRLSYNLYVNNGRIGFEIGTQSRPGLAGNITFPGSLLSKDTWHDLMARYDGAELSLYLDGTRVARGPATGLLRRNDHPLHLGGALRGELDHAALWARALSEGEIITLSGGAQHVTARLESRRPGVERLTGRDGLTTTDQLRAARELRGKLAADPHRPRYHLMPPDGFWNDINGTLYWKGRYHVMFLGRQAPPAQTVLEGKDSDFPREIWLHASSADLVHWIHHPPSLTPVFDGSMPQGLYSGDAIEGAPGPTLIYHVPGQGTSIATAADPHDPELIHWTPSPHNPVITPGTAPREVSVFDPTAWMEEDGTYYALVGNKSGAPGHGGDSTSLFRSRDLRHWEYRGPFYQSNRAWTHGMEDAACPDFFPMGNGKHMLLMHGHRPFFNAHYYIGTWDRGKERFTPEHHARMTWPGGTLCAPETLLDAKGRRIFWGWVPDTPMRRKETWASVATLPRILSLAADHTLRIQPAPELEKLRHNERTFTGLTVTGEHTLQGASGDTVELRARIIPGQSRKFGISVRRSPGGEEQLPIWLDLDANTLSADLTRISLDPQTLPTRTDDLMHLEQRPADQRFITAQTAPFTLKPDEPVDLRIFIDKSIVEVFVNDRQCLTQRLYPTRPDALGITLLSQDVPITVENISVWDMHPTQ